MAAILNGRILGTIRSCGMMGEGILGSTEGDAAIISEKYD